MSVELDPVELGFRRPFTTEVEEKLRLRNPNSAPVAFKVKTTAPKQYCVRPNSGRIEAGQNVEVSVLLQAMKEDPPADAKCRDKFLVQSVAVSANEEFTNVSQMWSSIESNTRSSIHEKKIRVNFLQPSSDGVATPSRTSTSVLGQDDQPPAYSSPMTNADTPQQQPTREVDIKQETPEPATEQSTTGATTASAVGSAVPTSTQDFKQLYEDAQREIQKLVKQTQEQGLRQRKSDAVNKDAEERITTGTTGMGVQQAPPSGVPVPIVAALCLLSFLLAYMLF